MDLLWDTRTVKLKCLVLGAASAGKTSLLRRYVFHTFDGLRRPTQGSDFYSHTIQNQQLETEEGDMSFDITTHLQLWDTPGRERFYLKHQPKITTSLSDDFFSHVDGVMLVYDMTSSTSFTQMLRWYADLMQIRDKSQDPQRLSFPILIVGNKLDAFDAMQQRATTDMHPRRVAQRDVLGLKGKDFKGKDFQYEYRVSSPVRSPLLGNHKQMQQPQHKNRRNHHHSSHLIPLRGFLANRENWTTDNSYLDSLLNSEDGSHPDHDMVLLWCMRNGLSHVEASAATGQGVEDAFETLTHMALEFALNMVYNDDRPSFPEGASMLEAPTPRPLLSTDLQERYRSNTEDCCFGLLPSPARWMRRR